MCERAFENDPCSLQYVPDWFVTRELVTMCYDNIEYEDDDDEDNFLTGTGTMVIKHERFKKPQ